MPIVTRNITNAPNHPIWDSFGLPAKKLTVEIQLVDFSDPPRPIDVWDAVSKEMVFSVARTFPVSSAGLMTFSLWPNSRGNIPSQYCFSFGPARRIVYASVPEGDLSELQWSDLVLGSQPVDPVGMSVVQDLLARVAALEAAIAAGGLPPVAAAATYDDASSATYDDGSPITGG